MFIHSTTSQTLTNKVETLKDSVARYCYNAISDCNLQVREIKRNIHNLN